MDLLLERRVPSLVMMRVLSRLACTAAALVVFAGVRGLRSPCWRRQRPRRVGGSLVEVGGDVRGLEEVWRLVDDAGELGEQLEEMGDRHMEWYGGGRPWAVQRPGRRLSQA